MNVLITGITGQDGAYLSQLLISKGYNVVGLVRDILSIGSNGLQYLKIYDQVVFEEIDLTKKTAIIKLLEKYQPFAVFNLAAQSSVSQSFKEPNETIHFNIISVLNILEGIRQVNASIKFYQASSSEMYGKVNNLPISEQTVMHPLSPYAISKASAHWITVNYREAYGLFSCCGILFNHDSYLRSANFFTKKIILGALAIRSGTLDFLKVGNIEVKRDFGYAPKYVEAMMLMIEQDMPDDYLICSGKSIFLHEIISHVFDRLNISMDKLVIDKSLYRPAEILDIYGAPYKAKAQLGWKYDFSYFEVLDILIEEELVNQTL